MLGIAVPFVVLRLRNGDCCRLTDIGDMEGVVLYTRKSLVVGLKSNLNIRVSSREYIGDRCAVVVSGIGGFIPSKFRGVFVDGNIIRSCCSYVFISLFLIRSCLM